ncbi:tRNA (adenine(58)-N(1))-methyltransferase non-catalytic subunit trm6 [Kappamyces sp. JEL0829]|nr:tRNA (adenine(58)-N(1))-methyltransferase non-catalytic subunit trm6 [Kappamyces sp. JEL0829]
MEPKPEWNPDIIGADSNVIIKMPSGNYKTINLAKESVVSLGKFGSFRAKELVGKYFNVALEIYDRDKLRVVDNVNYLEDFSIDPTLVTEATNQDILDRVENQKLSNDEILAMKAAGLAGEMDHQEIISKLGARPVLTTVSNHGKFHEKTEFSKAKYIKKKVQKFAKLFVPLVPNSLNQVEYQTTKGNSERIKELRVDTLSQILTFANVRAGSRILCVDDSGGLLTLALLERTHGMGDMVVFHDGQNASVELVRQSNLPEHIKNSFTTFSWFRFHEPFVLEDVVDEKDKERQENRHRRFVEVDTLIRSGGFDSLIVCSTYNNKEILERLAPFLTPSAKVVIYSPRKELLLPCYEHARSCKTFINTQLSESWMREYQVPVHASGTHPLMMTSGSGGFVFTCTYITEEGCEVIEKPTYKSLKDKQYKRQKTDPGETA